MWVEFVVGSRPCSRSFFSGFSGFPLFSKTNSSKFKFYAESEGHGFASQNRLTSVIRVKQSSFQKVIRNTHPSPFGVQIENSQLCLF